MPQLLGQTPVHVAPHGQLGSVNAALHEVVDIAKQPEARGQRQSLAGRLFSSKSAAVTPLDISGSLPGVHVVPVKGSPEINFVPAFGKFRISLYILLPVMVTLLIAVTGGVTAFLSINILTSTVTELNNRAQEDRMLHVASYVGGAVLGRAVSELQAASMSVSSGLWNKRTLFTATETFSSAQQLGFQPSVSAALFASQDGATYIAGKASGRAFTVALTNPLNSSTPAAPKSLYVYTVDSNGIPYSDVPSAIIPFELPRFSWPPLSSTNTTMRQAGFVWASLSFSPLDNDLALVLATRAQTGFWATGISDADRIDGTAIWYLDVARSWQRFLSDFANSRASGLELWIVDSEGLLLATTLTSPESLVLLANTTSHERYSAADSSSSLVRNSWYSYVASKGATRVTVLCHLNSTTNASTSDLAHSWSDNVMGQSERYLVSGVSLVLPNCNLRLTLFVATLVDQIYSARNTAFKETILFNVVAFVCSAVFTLLMTVSITRPVAVLGAHMQAVAQLRDRSKPRTRSFLQLLNRTHKAFNDGNSKASSLSSQITDDVTPTVNNNGVTKLSLANIRRMRSSRRGSTMAALVAGSARRRQDHEDGISDAESPSGSGSADESSLHRRLFSFSWASRHVTELSNLYVSFQNVESAIQSFMRYVPEEVVKRLIKSGKAAELSLQHVNITCMFIDMENFTMMSEQLSLSQLAQVMQMYFDVVVATVKASGGVIDKFIGDGVMCFWNAPTEIENHELQAVKCAMRASRELSKTVSEHLAQMGLPPISARFGIHTGECMVGNVGSRERFNYTCMGDAVNLASRLEGLCKHYKTQILVSRELYSRVSDHFLGRWVDRSQVKGRLQATDLYEIVEFHQRSTQEQRHFCNLTERGMQAFVCKDVITARDCFSHALTLRPDDPALEDLLDRSEKSLTSPDAYHTVTVFK